MSLVTGKDTKNRKKGTKKGKTAAKPTPKDNFNRAWKKVQNQQAKNDRFMAEVESFVTSVEAQIGATEREYIQSLYAGCQHLLPFLQRKSLSRWQKETLIDWLLDDIEAIHHNPFGGHLDLTALQADINSIIDELNPKPEFESDEFSAEDWEIAEEEPLSEPGSTGDLFDEAFAEFDEDEDFEFDRAEDDPFAEFFREQQAHHAARKEKSRSLSQLLKGSSVNKLFRKLARALHPDLEQDEAAREHKHHLMVELIDARESNDIPKIFSLYAQHVGDSPLAELGDDLEIATQLLLEQCDDLRHRQQEMLEENPRWAAIYRRFHHKNALNVQRAIRKHLDGLEDLIAEQQRLMGEATTVKKLKSYLQERQGMDMIGNMLDELDFLFDMPVNFR